MGTLATLEERVAVIEEQVKLIPEIRGDVKSLLAFMNRVNGFGSGSNNLVTKALAVVSLIVAILAMFAK